MLKFLVVDDDDILRFSVRKILESRSYEVDEASDGIEALSMIEDRVYDGIFLDVNMPNMSGLETLSRIRQKNLSTFCVVLSAYSNVEDAFSAMKMGAYDYLEKPVTSEKLFSLIDDALNTSSIVKMAGYCAPVTELDFGGGRSMIGESESIKKVFDLIYKLALVDSSVLIMGESGTGKELVARALHYSSSRKRQPFVVVNCGAIPENLVESELFGHERGAFTGADRKKIGKFQYANGGTLFLDEIGDMPLLAQVKLLRVLQEGRFTPVGSNQEVSVDVRIIAATNKHLVKLVSEGKFRADLFYRLNVFPITLPPLRERIKDIKNLCYYLIDKLNKKDQISHVGNKSNQIKDIDYLALKALESYSWPGNIRELENVVEHAYVLETGSQISLKSLPEYIREDFEKKVSEKNIESFNGAGSDMRENTSGVDSKSGIFTSFADEGDRLDFISMKEQFEKSFLLEALKRYKGRINQIALSTNITKMTLLRKLDKYGLDPKEFHE